MRLQPMATLGLLTLALAVVGCETHTAMGGLRLGIDAVGAGPLSVPAGASTLTVPVGASTLTVQLDAETLRKLTAGGRSLQAVVSDINYVTVVVQPLADAAMAEAVLARQLSDVRAAFESVHADVALAAQVCPASGRLYDTHHCR